ncbi:MAG: alpha/beta fold hydrolase [Acidimicrobiia bacterium]|nr:alpha/beta fold hydrolase [Acidimicrobiia bacterium]
MATRRARPAPSTLPAAGLDRVETALGAEVVVRVAANDEDPDGGPVRLTRLATTPPDGEATPTPEGAVRYVPPEGFEGVATFSYELVDDEGDTATGEVEVDVGDTTDAEETAIGWSRCTFPDEEPEVAAGLEEQFADSECATVDVPRDYDDPGLGTLELFVARRPAPADDPIGPLFLNQGGPGMEAARYSANYMANPKLDRFDLVGMDPRGTGRSTSVDCGGSTTELPEPVVPAPDAPATGFERAGRGHAEACVANDPNLPHYGTNNVARDIDRLRELMGEERISYIGQSYGSDLGLVYTSLFPERVRAAVLDGATDLRLDLVDFLTQQGEASRARLERHFADCRDEGCGVTGDDDPSAASGRPGRPARRRTGHRPRLGNGDQRRPPPGLHPRRVRDRRRGARRRPHGPGRGRRGRGPGRRRARRLDDPGARGQRGDHLSPTCPSTGTTARRRAGWWSSCRATRPGTSWTSSRCARPGPSATRWPWTPPTPPVRSSSPPPPATSRPRTSRAWGWPSCWPTAATSSGTPTPTPRTSAAVASVATSTRSWSTSRYRRRARRATTS